MKLSKKIFLFFLLFGIFLLSGCGIEVSTDMNINQAFEGTRTISCYVSKQDMHLNFHGDSKKIDTIIENHCPAALEYSKNELNSGTEYIFKLNFSSLEDYKNQLSSILNFNPQVHYKGVNGLFSKSIDLEENFTSIDLLRWFEILLTEEYSITEEELEKLWNIQDTTITWLDNEYLSETDTIQISDHKLTAFDGISIYTEETKERTFIRKIQFAIPKDTLDKYMIQLEKAFEEIKPEGTTGIWQTTDTGKIYELTFQADDFESLSQKTGAALNSKSTAISVNSNVLNNQYLKLQLEYSETLDFSYFLSTDTGEVPISYYFKPNSMTEIDSERIQREINNSFIPKEYGEGFYRIYTGNCSTLKITTLGKMTIPITGYKITTTVKKEDQFKREFLFYFENILKKNEEELLSSALNANSNDTLTLKLKNNAGSYTLSIIQKGTKDNLNHSSSLLFGEENNTFLVAEQNFLQNLSSHKLTEIQEQIDLTQFIGSNYNDLTGSYLLEDRTSNTIEELYIKTGTDEIIESTKNGNSIQSISVNGSKFTVYYTGSVPSMSGIIILALLLIILFVCFLLFVKKNPMKKHS